MSQEITPTAGRGGGGGGCGGHSVVKCPSGDDLDLTPALTEHLSRCFPLTVEERLVSRCDSSVSMKTNSVSGPVSVVQCQWSGSGRLHTSHRYRQADSNDLHHTTVERHTATDTGHVI